MGEDSGEGYGPAKDEAARTWVSGPYERQDQASTQTNGGNAISKLHAEIRSMYEKYNPEKLSQLSEILQKYEGGEQKLLQALRKKYEQDETGKAASVPPPKQQMCSRLLTPQPPKGPPPKSLLAEVKPQADLVMRPPPKPKPSAVWQPQQGATESRVEELPHKALPTKLRPTLPRPQLPRPRLQPSASPRPVLAGRLSLPDRREVKPVADVKEEVNPPDPAVAQAKARLEMYNRTAKRRIMVQKHLTALDVPEDGRAKLELGILMLHPGHLSKVIQLRPNGEEDAAAVLTDKLRELDASVLDLAETMETAGVSWQGPDIDETDRIVGEGSSTDWGKGIYQKENHGDEQQMEEEEKASDACNYLIEVAERRVEELEAHEGLRTSLHDFLERHSSFPEEVKLSLQILPGEQLQELLAAAQDIESELQKQKADSGKWLIDLIATFEPAREELLKALQASSKKGGANLHPAASVVANDTPVKAAPVARPPAMAGMCVPRPRSAPTRPRGSVGALSSVPGPAVLQAKAGRPGPYSVQSVIRPKYSQQRE